MFKNYTYHRYIVWKIHRKKNLSHEIIIFEKRSFYKL